MLFSATGTNRLPCQIDSSYSAHSSVTLVTLATTTGAQFEFEFFFSPEFKKKNYSIFFHLILLLSVWPETVWFFPKYIICFVIASFVLQLYILYFRKIFFGIVTNFFQCPKIDINTEFM